MIKNTEYTTITKVGQRFKVDTTIADQLPSSAFTGLTTNTTTTTVDNINNTIAVDLDLTLIPTKADISTVFSTKQETNKQKEILLNRIDQVTSKLASDFNAAISVAQTNIIALIPTKVSQLTNDKKYITLNEFNSTLNSYAKKIDIPTRVSQLANDIKYTTEADVSLQFNSLVDNAPTALNTLNKISKALNNDPSFYINIASELAAKQELLKNSINIKSINGKSILGQGNMSISEFPTNLYTVKFLNNNNLYTTQQAQKFTLLDKPDDPQPKNPWTDIFDGWYLNDEKWSFSGNLVTKDLTLTAKWLQVEPPKATVNIDLAPAHGGDAEIITPSSSTIRVGDVVEFLVAPNDGYKIDTVSVNGVELLPVEGTEDTFNFTVDRLENTINVSFKVGSSDYKYCTINFDCHGADNSPIEITNAVSYETPLPFGEPTYNKAQNLYAVSPLGIRLGSSTKTGQFEIDLSKINLASKNITKIEVLFAKWGTSNTEGTLYVNDINVGDGGSKSNTDFKTITVDTKEVLKPTVKIHSIKRCIIKSITLYIDYTLA